MVVAPVQRAGLLMLGVMAAGVLTVTVSSHASTPAGDVDNGGWFPFAASVQTPTVIAGTATFYAEDFQGRIMANGVAFDMDDPSIAAANQWPLGTRLRLRRAPGGPWDATLSPQERDLYFNRSVIVTVQDHGDFTHALDLSRAAFAQLGRTGEGVIHLTIEVLGTRDTAQPVTTPTQP